MNRKITVVSQAIGGKPITINSTATTLCELKAELRNNHISYSDSDVFKEGKTKITFTNNSEVLPTNVNYGGVTNDDLVIMIAPSKRKISSGADFMEMLKESGLLDVLKASGFEVHVATHASTDSSEEKEESKDSDKVCMSREKLSILKQILATTMEAIDAVLED